VPRARLAGNQLVCLADGARGVLHGAGAGALTIGARRSQANSPKAAAAATQIDRALPDDSIRAPCDDQHSRNT
jgi:hypothetical protein